ncbi:24087_t:CDS:1, partial [Dentiscutata erythropus]
SQQNSERSKPINSLQPNSAKVPILTHICNIQLFDIVFTSKAQETPTSNHPEAVSFKVSIET